jgi:hypothetical protein
VARVREREKKILGRIASGISPPLCPFAKRQGESERGEWREGGQARVLHWSILQREEGEKEESKRRARVVWPKFK